jgi:hypothetical protein
MTEADIAERESRINNRLNVRKNASDYESRIKELENAISTLLSKLPQEE